MKVIILVTMTVLVLATANALPRIDLYKLVVSNDIDNSEAMADQELSKTAVVSHSLYIPMELKGCNNSGCDSVCRALGFNHGRCVSADTCRCYN